MASPSFWQWIYYSSSWQLQCSAYNEYADAWIKMNDEACPVDDDNRKMASRLQRGGYVIGDIVPGRGRHPGAQLGELWFSLTELRA